jgi:DNA-binding LacI/PurR family transcriptional regulator
MGAYLYSIAIAARERGYVLMLFADQDGSEALQLAARTKRIDGAIFLEVKRDDTRIKTAKELSLPSVLLGEPGDSTGIDFVDTNFETAARTLLEYLYKHGHRKVIFLGEPESVYDQDLNYAFRFQSAVQSQGEKKGMEIYPFFSQKEPLGSSESVKKAIKKYPQATAMIIHNDAAAVSATGAFNELKMRVPQDISVVAIIPDQLFTGAEIPFTNISINLETIAELTVDTLIQRIENPGQPYIHTLVDQPLIVRKSVATISR